MLGPEYRIHGRILHRAIVYAIVGNIRMPEEDIEAMCRALYQRKGDHLEIGSAYGGSAILAHLCKQEGEIWCVDPFGDYSRGYKKIHNYSSDPTAEILMANCAVFGFAPRHFPIATPGLPEEITSHRFDSALIDGDHHHAHVMADWNAVKHIVDGLVIFHDISGAPGAIYKAACEEPGWRKAFASDNVGVVKNASHS